MFNIKSNDSYNPSFCQSIRISFSSKLQKKYVERITDSTIEVLENLSLNVDVQDRVKAFQQAEKIVRKYEKSKKYTDTIKKLDRYIKIKQRQLYPNRPIESKEFLHPENQKNFARWARYGFSEDVFFEHPEFANFLLITYIANSMKTWGEQISFVDNQPMLLMDGKLVHWIKVKDSIEMRYHPESRTQRIYKKGSNKPMEYLGAGKGLVECDRYHDLPVVTRISEGERKHILKLGQAYQRPSEAGIIAPKQDREYVLQVVVPTRKSELGKGNLSTLFLGTSHPYLRMIDPDGNVKIVGFMKFNNNKNKLCHGPGMIDSPDFGDLVLSGERYVTNIAISKNEAKKFENTVNCIRANKNTTFNYSQLNCSSFVKYMLSELQLADMPKSRPIVRVFADLLTFGAAKRRPISERVTENQKKCERNPIVRIALSVLKAIGTILWKPLLLALGDRPFYKFGESASPSDNKISRFLKWLFEPVVIDFPAQIVAWQQTNEQTEFLPQSNKMAISSFFSKLGQTIGQQKIHSLPGFGTPIIDETKRSLAKKVWNVFKNTLYYITGLGIFRYFMKQLGNSMHPGKREITLHPEMVRHNEQKGPKVGQLVDTDIRVINNCGQSYLFKLELLRSAQQSIDISFNFAGGEHFDHVLDLLEQKIKERPNIKINLILSDDFVSEEQIIRMQKLKVKHAKNFKFLVTTRYFLNRGGRLRSEENHAKMLIVDGKYFVVGGTGIIDQIDREVSLGRSGKEGLAAKLIDPTTREVDIIGCGELAGTMRGQFYNLYQIWAKRMNHPLENQEGVYTPLVDGDKGVCELFHEEEGLIEGASMRFLVGGPEHQANNPITNEITKNIEQSQKSIQIANLYFNPAKQIKKALKDKVKKIDILGIFNGVGNGISAVHYNYALMNRRNYDLVNKGLEYQVPDRLYHKKVTLFDDDRVMVGSYNMGYKSAYCDNETMLSINDRRVVKALRQGIDEDIKNSKVLYSKKLNIDKRPFWTTFFGHAYALGARLCG